MQNLSIKMLWEITRNSTHYNIILQFKGMTVSPRLLQVIIFTLPELYASSSCCESCELKGIHVSLWIYYLTIKPMRRKLVHTNCQHPCLRAQRNYMNSGDGDGSDWDDCSCCDSTDDISFSKRQKKTFRKKFPSINSVIVHTHRHTHTKKTGLFLRGISEENN